MRANLFKIPLGLAIVSLLASCASTSLVDTWKNPELSARRLGKVLVVSMNANNGIRRLNENVLAADLRQRGVDALQGHTLLPDDHKADLPTLQRAVAKAGAEGVLTIQTIKIEQQSSYHPGYVTGYYPGYWYPSAFPSWNLYGYYGSSMFYEAPYLTTWEVTTVQVSLFEAGSGKLLWAGTVQTYEPERNIAFSRNLSRIVVGALLKEGII